MARYPLRPDAATAADSHPSALLSSWRWWCTRPTDRQTDRIVEYLRMPRLILRLLRAAAPPPPHWYFWPILSNGCQVPFIHEHSSILKVRWISHSFIFQFVLLSQSPSTYSDPEAAPAGWLEGCHFSGSLWNRDALQMYIPLLYRASDSFFCWSINFTRIYCNRTSSSE